MMCRRVSALVVMGLLTLLGVAGCSSTGTGSSSYYVTTGAYYGGGAGWYDPYYYQPCCRGGVIVGPPPGYRPGNRPPNVRPPTASQLPSVPSQPRPTPRR